MSNSPLVVCTILSPNHCARTAKIDTITIHHMANNWTVEKCGREFSNRLRWASSNYGVDSEGRIALYVPEDRRAWTSSNWKNDDRAVTIEVANDGRWPDWHVSDKALEAIIALGVDICQRNGIPKLNYTGWKDGNLTRHNMFIYTTCPGAYLESKFPYIAEEVNRRLGAAPEQPKEEAPEAEETPLEKPPMEEQPTGTAYRVQIGAFDSKFWAQHRCKAVEKKGFKAYVIGAGKVWRVQVGAFQTKDEATQHMEKLKEAGFRGFVTVSTIEAA